MSKDVSCRVSYDIDGEQVVTQLTLLVEVKDLEGMVIHSFI